ncbi:MAG: PPC domain-containing DNA-binding protein [Euryarchaeota archaeon]|nr:PPC domain-containing DNA-binding protein [Euryarchaeota archaeon]MEA2052593.1 PPC domain-containing DNA-binding protein [Euryarchaeota archaeon]
MKYSEAKQGRTFVIRLEDGDIIHEELEEFARVHSINAAAVIAVGGADEGSKLVVGPEQGRSATITPMEHVLGNVREIAGVGTIFPDKDRNPVLHMHIACGREESTVTGCVRRGVKVWHLLELILFELLDSSASRMFDEQTGFELLEP